MRNFITGGLAVLFLGPVILTRADDEVCGTCDHVVQVSGELHHFKAAGDKSIQGAPPGGEAAFREEIWAPTFNITVSRLPAGKYTVVVGEVENFFPQAGQRVFSVSCGDTSLATNFDIIAVA